MPAYSWLGYAYQIGSIEQVIKHARCLVGGWWNFSRAKVVGDTHAIEALGSNNQLLTGLTWTTSDSTIVSLAPHPERSVCLN